MRYHHKLKFNDKRYQIDHSMIYDYWTLDCCSCVRSNRAGSRWLLFKPKYHFVVYYSTWTLWQYLHLQYGGCIEYLAFGFIRKNSIGDEWWIRLLGGYSLYQIITSGALNWFWVTYWLDCRSSLSSRSLSRYRLIIKQSLTLASVVFIYPLGMLCIAYSVIDITLLNRIALCLCFRFDQS